MYLGTNFPNTASWQQRVDVPVSGGPSLVPLPDSVDLAEAAQLFVNPVTVAGFFWEMEQLGIKSDDDVVAFTAGNSAVVKMVMQLKKLRNFPGRFVSIVRSPERIQEMTDLGASAVISTAQTPDIEVAINSNAFSHE